MGLLLLVFILTIGLGFLLIFFIKKTSKRLPGEAEPPLPPSLQGLSFDDFYTLCCRLLEKLGLKINDSYRDRDLEADIYAENPSPLIGGPVIVHLHLYPDDGRITSMDVMNFAGNLVGDRRGKGLYLTTGQFGPDVATLPELPPMDLIDGDQLVALLQEHHLVEENPTRPTLPE